MKRSFEEQNFPDDFARKLLSNGDYSNDDYYRTSKNRKVNGNDIAEPKVIQALLNSTYYIDQIRREVEKHRKLNPKCDNANFFINFREILGRIGPAVASILGELFQLSLNPEILNQIYMSNPDPSVKRGSFIRDRIEETLSLLESTWIKMIDSANEWKNYCKSKSLEKLPGYDTILNIPEILLNATIESKLNTKEGFIDFPIEEIKLYFNIEGTELENPSVNKSIYWRDNKSVFVRDLIRPGCKYPIKELYRVLSELISSHRMSFPYKKYYITNPVMLFENLKNLGWPIVETRGFELPGIHFKTGLFWFNFDYSCLKEEVISKLVERNNNKFLVGSSNESKYFCIISENCEYDQINIITDYFQEKCRLSAMRNDQEECVLDWWKIPENNERVFKHLVKTNQDFNTYNMREVIFKFVKECTQFKASLVKNIIDIFDSTKMLDFSAGWGDRLIGAMGSKLIKYTGVDPNTDLREGYDLILSTLLPDDHEKRENYKILPFPFQTVELSDDETYDLVFTSPPYFNFERYSGKKGQSIVDHPQFNDWCINFLFFSIEKAWKRLEVGGNLIIHITDTKGSNVCEPMNLFIASKLPGAKYMGVIASRGAKGLPRPMWAWRKQENSDEKLQRLANEKILKHFSGLFKSKDFEIFK